MTLDHFLLEQPAAAHELTCPAGACLYQVGTIADCLYWLEGGSVEVTTPGRGPRMVCAPALLGGELLADPICGYTARVATQAARIRAIDLAPLRDRCASDFGLRLFLLRLMSRQGVLE